MMKKFSDSVLDSLYQRYTEDPRDLHLKRYLGMELHRKGFLRDAYPILIEVFEEDSDPNIERILLEIEDSLPPETVVEEPPSVLEALEKASKAKRDLLTFDGVAGMISETQNLPRSTI